MAELVNKSLSDIIADEDKRRKSQTAKRGGAPRRGRQSSRGRGAGFQSRRGRVDANPPRGRGRMGTRGGRATQARGRGPSTFGSTLGGEPLNFRVTFKAGPARRGRRSAAAANSVQPFSRGGDPDSDWGHDMYHFQEQQEFGSTAPMIKSVIAPMQEQQQHQQQQQVVATAREPISFVTKLMITNLDPEITSEDIFELFNKIGSGVVEAFVHTNDAGFSKGTAEVVYRQKADAAAAIEEYDRREVDGRVIRVQMLGTSRSSASKGNEVSAAPHHGAGVVPVAAAQARGRGPARGLASDASQGVTNAPVTFQEPRTNSFLDRFEEERFGSTSFAFRSAGGPPRRMPTVTRGGRGRGGRGRRGGSVRGGRGRGIRQDGGAAPSADDLDAMLDAYRTKQ